MSTNPWPTRKQKFGIAFYAVFLSATLVFVTWMLVDEVLRRVLP